MYGLDLFSGIGGITKALEGYVQPIAYCENDRYAQGVLLSRMRTGDIPTAPIWDDVQTLTRSALGDSPDIIYGGFPCQDISIAGRGEGLAGKRSGLFSEIARIVGDIRPEFIFLENVPAINRRGGDVLVGTLADLGYDARWDVLSAADVGANHRRERWWLLAYSARNGRIRGRSETADTGRPGTKRQAIPVEGICEGLADTDVERWKIGPWESISGIQRIDADSRAGGGWWKSEPNVGRVAHGVPKRVDRLRCLGNAVVPSQAREAFERLIGIRDREEA